MISATSPAVTRRRRALDVSDTSDMFGSFPLSSSPNSSTFPLLPREIQDTAMSSKSATPPEKPLIMEGNRLRHLTDALQNIKVLADVINTFDTTRKICFIFV